MSPASERGPAVAFVGVGSNLADPVSQVRTALEELRTMEGTLAVSTSSLYRSPPMGPPDQPDYVNAVARLETTLTPLALLDALQGLERAHGRERRGERWGPRTLDLDVLLYDDACIEEARLQVPHPGIAERAFVVLPLFELAPDLALPDGRRIEGLAHHFTDSGVSRL